MIASASPPYRLEAGAVRLTVRLTPKADRDRIDGIGQLDDGRAVARIRVRAVPADGAANAALIAVIAKALRRPKSSVEIVSGHSQRVKQVRVAGDPGALVPLLEAWSREP